MAERDFGTIVQIGDVLVSEEVFTEFFACDYEKCKGVCCIEGDAGAPLAEGEASYLESVYSEFCGLMTDGGRDAVEVKGFSETDPEGDEVTPVVDYRDAASPCAFAHFGKGGECLCSIEKCGLRKPVSCSLYPIRVTKFNGGGCALNFHKWAVCQDAFEKGRREGVRVYQFLKGPLQREFGEEFYQALCAVAPRVIE